MTSIERHQLKEELERINGQLAVVASSTRSEVAALWGIRVGDVLLTCTKMLDRKFELERRLSL